VSAPAALDFFTGIIDALVPTPPPPDEAAIPARLVSAVDSYRRSNPEYGTPSGAYDQCWWASLGFQDHLDRLGFIRESRRGRRRGWDVVLVSRLGPWQDDLPPMMALHWVFRWNDLAIDWTMRQAIPDAPFPAAWRLRDGDWDPGNGRIGRR
jgi:hypothetical protein